MQKKRALTTGIFAFLAILLFGITPMVHADPGVKDDGQFFKPETVEKANAEIRQIKSDYAKELVIETFAGVPEGLRDEWDAAKDDAQKRSGFFGKWSGDRAHRLQVNGVYILICKDPGHLEVKAGQKTKLKAFTESNQNKLRDILLESFKAKNDDEGLLKGVDYFREALKENLGGPHPATPAATGDEQFKHPNSGNSSGSALPTRNPAGRVPAASTFQWSSIMSIILIVIAAIVIIRVLARLTGGSRNSGGGGYGPGQGNGPGYGAGYGGGGGYGGQSGGGGFFRNMFGGLLGGAAGSYLYDQYRDRNNPAQNSQNYNAGNAPDNSSGGDFTSQSSSDDNDRGQGFGGGGSGGDFGSSGSDSGGGFSSSDSGGSSGGDFGSSDSGSSGGDSGGGGGDF